MEMEKILNLSDAELTQQQRQAGEQLFRLRFQMRMGQNDGLQKLRGLKKDIARIQTVARQRELGIVTVHAVSAHPDAPRAAKPVKSKAAKKVTPKVAHKAAVKAKSKTAAKAKKAAAPAAKKSAGSKTAGSKTAAGKTKAKSTATKSKTATKAKKETR